MSDWSPDEESSARSGKRNGLSWTRLIFSLLAAGGAFAYVLWLAKLNASLGTRNPFAPVYFFVPVILLSLLFVLVFPLWFRRFAYPSLRAAFGGEVDWRIGGYRFRYRDISVVYMHRVFGDFIRFRIGGFPEISLRLEPERERSRLRSALSLPRVFGRLRLSIPFPGFRVGIYSRREEPIIRYFESPHAREVMKRLFDDALAGQTNVLIVKDGDVIAQLNMERNLMKPAPMSVVLDCLFELFLPARDLAAQQ